MPGGARPAAFSSTKTAQARERINVSTYFRFSRKLTSSGPALSSGATSRHTRPPSAGFTNLAPLNADNASRVKGPPRLKKRGSAILPSHAGQDRHQLGIVGTKAWPTGIGGAAFCRDGQRL